MSRLLGGSHDTYWPATYADLSEVLKGTPSVMNVDAPVEAVLLLADSCEMEYSGRATVTLKNIRTL